MSEPRAVASRLEPLTTDIPHSDLSNYHLEDERIDTRSDAYVLASAEGAILIDPLPLADAAFASIGPVASIVLTTPHHQRSAWRLRHLIRVPVRAPHGATGLVERPDVEYGDGDLLPGGLRALHTPGPDGAHHVLHLAAGPGLLFLADLLLRQADGVVRHLKPEYLKDPEAARRSLRQVLELPFDAVAFGHGGAIVKGGKRALEEVALRDR